MMSVARAKPRMHKALAWASLLFVAGAAVLGWAASFVGLHDYGQIRLHGFTDITAWFVPGAIDGAAFATSLMTYRASIKGRVAMHGRLLMWGFTAASSWINWIHQTDSEARIVAAGLPVAAVAVFDVVLKELRHDFEEKSGKKAFRLRLGLLFLRWLVDRHGTASAFKGQITAIPVETLAGLGLEHVSATPSNRTSDATVPNMSGTSDLTVTPTVARDTEHDGTPDAEIKPETVTSDNRVPNMSVQVNATYGTRNRTPDMTVPDMSGTPDLTVTPTVARDTEHDRKPDTEIKPETVTPDSHVPDTLGRTQVMPVIDRDTAADDLAKMTSAAEQVRYAADVLGHVKPAEVTAWLNGFGYEISGDTVRKTLTRYHKQASARRAVLRLDERKRRAE